MRADKPNSVVANDSYSSLSSEALVKEINQVVIASEKAIRKLTITLFICIIFMIIECVGGYIAHSLAIMTDAAHLLSDCVGFIISIFSIWMGRKPHSALMTFGFHRSEILGAFVSVVLIYGLTIWLVVEGIHRIYNPVAINGFIMLLTAGFGLACNIVMATTLHNHHGHSHGNHHHEHEHKEEHAKHQNELTPSPNGEGYLDSKKIFINDDEQIPSLQSNSFV
jgi:solute carrier family 30 (zinc transporter), member 2